LEDFAERDLQVFLDVIAESLERRDVKNFRSIEQFATEGFAN